MTDRLAYARDYYRRPGVKEARAAWRDANRDTVRAQQRRSHVKRVALNPEFGKEARDRRRARLKGAAGRHTTDDWLLVITRFEHRCAYCGKPELLVKDHLLPLCRGGTDWPENLVPACSGCNGTKGGREPVEAIHRLAAPERVNGLLALLEQSYALPGTKERRAYLKVSDAALLAEARRIMAEFGKITVVLLNEHSRYASSSYERRFGGMKGLKQMIAAR